MVGGLLLVIGATTCSPTDAGAIVTHRATTCNSMENGGTLTVTKPAGVVANDILIASAVQNDGGNMSPPAGWTVLQADQSDAASWYRVAGGSEPASYSFTKSGGDTFGVVISAFAGGDPAAPIAGSAKAYGTTSSQALPNATGLRNGSMRFSSAGLSPSNNATATYSGGMTKSCERAGDDASISAAYEATGAGTTASRTVSFSASDDHWLYTAVVNAALPAITSIAPVSGPTAGGQTVTITGTNFTSASSVTFGGTAGTSVNVVNDSTITVVTPARAIGTYDVRVTTPPGTSPDAGTADDYSYVAPPTITSISPTAGPTAGGTSVTITGTNFVNLTGGAAAVQFGTTNATSYTLVNATTITAVAPAQAAGVQNVRVTTLGGTTANTADDDYTYYATPTITSISPTAGPTAGGNTVTITGTNFGGLSGAAAVRFGTTNATSYTVVNATTITAVAPALAAGVQDIRVTTPGGTTANTAADDYTYHAPATVTALSPATGPATGGNTVTITGTNFTGLSGAAAVQFGGVNATSYTVVNATTITATAPAGTGTVDVRITTPGGTSANTAADNYVYVPAPTVTSLSPTAGPTGGGNTVTITGTNFTGASAVTFGGTNATGYTVVNATTITATAPAGSAGTVDVRVTTVGGQSANTAADNYTYVAAPTVTSLSPTAGPSDGGTTVTITGTNFTGASAVKFGGTNATSYTVVNATTITATAPARTAGTYDVLVTTAGGTSANTAADNYTYVAAPTVTSLSPTAGPVAGGTTVTITGTNFTGATAVTFGGTNATSYTVVNATTITATAPARTAGTYDVLVTTVGGTSANTAADNYTYANVPTVTSLSPTSGPTAGGTTVTITGTNFTGATAVTFGGTNATGYTVVNATTITATAPARAAGTIDVRVTTAGGQSPNTASDDYGYVAAPTVTALSPDEGPTAGGTTVTITGTNFTGASSVTFGGTSATSFTVVNATTIAATSPARAAGTYDVLVTTVGGTSANTAADNYTYVPAPTVTSLSPTSGPSAGGTTVTITGTNFTGATAVTFGGTNATSFTIVNATTITATSPPRAAGTYDVRVTTPGGLSANTAADNYTYLSAPTVTALSPSSGSTLGGTNVTITGTNFTGATAVTFGGTNATGYTVVNSTTITATAPARAAGIVDVRVTNPDGTSANTSADDFTYVTTCSPGTLSAVDEDFSFGSVAHNGHNHTLSTSTTVTVSDMTGTNAGWKLGLGATVFDAGAGRVLPAGAARIVSSTATPLAGSCVAPTAAFTAYPVSVPTSPSTAKVYSAAVGTGTGPVEIELGAELEVPGNARTGTYQSTWTFDLTAAP